MPVGTNQEAEPWGTFNALCEAVGTEEGAWREYMEALESCSEADVRAEMARCWEP